MHKPADATSAYLDAAKALAERSAQAPTPLHDAEKAHTDALLAEARASGLFAVVVDPRHGGPGLSVADTARITFELARASGSLGLTYAMHMSQALTIVRHAPDTAYFNAFQARMVADQLLIASGTSEKGVGGDIFGSLCTVETHPESGLVISKETPNISYMDHAGAVLVTAMQARPKGKPIQVLVLAETAAMTLHPGREAGFLGMRGILNRSWSLEARFTEEAIFPAPYPAIARKTMTPAIHIFWAALWSGLAARALAKTKTFVAAHVPLEGPTGQTVRHDLSRLADRHHQLNALIRDAIVDEAAATASALDLGSAARLNRLKVAGSTLLLEILHGALQITGIQGYALTGPYSLATEYRDALSAPVMVSNYRLTANNAQLESYIEDRI